MPAQTGDGLMPQPCKCKAVCLSGFLLLSSEICALLLVLPRTSVQVGLAVFSSALCGTGTPGSWHHLVPHLGQV